jgi:hypothetical protein
MFANEVKYSDYNVICFKIDDDLLRNIFWEATSRFYYDLKIKINDKEPNVLFVDYYKDWLVILTDEDDDTFIEKPTIEFRVNLEWKIQRFNKLVNVRKDEIAQIYEKWTYDGDVMKMVETNFDDDARNDLFKIHLEEEQLDKTKKLVDKEYTPSNGIVDVDYVEVTDNQIGMNDNGG